MIKYENVIMNGKTLTHTWSDAGMRITNNTTGAVYDDVYDLPRFGYSYTETDIPIEEPESEAEEIVSILTGEAS